MNHGLKDTEKTVLLWYNKVKHQFTSIQPDPVNAIQNRSCHALFTISPFEPFTWVSVPCKMTFSEVDVICQKERFGMHNNMLNIPDIVKGMLDIYDNQCLVDGGIVLKSKCVQLMSTNITTMDKYEKNYTIYNNEFRISESIPPEELVIAILQPISRLQNFSYVLIHNQQCRILGPISEPGMHQMILKWEFANCESSYEQNVTNSTLLIYESQIASKQNRGKSPVCDFNNSFRCDNGTCLASTSACDGHVDCSTREDELNCTDLVHASSYMCVDGTVIKADKRCNLLSDCRDGDDEINCFHEINGCTQQFRCQSGQCIDLQYVCDGFYHCVDHTDENHCLNECSFGFLCNDSSCVLQSVKDDLVPDCNDKSDEPMYQLLLDRTIDKTYRCRESAMIPCEMGHNMCFPLKQLCLLEYNIHNHLTPCRNGANLKDCRHFPCTGSFKCPDSYCVPMRYMCNGKFDCPNGEDESGCPLDHMECPGLLRCKDGGCLHPSKICDGVVNCPHGDDEMCFLKCPHSCMCKGLVLFCTTLNGISFLQTRPLHLYLKVATKTELVFDENLFGLEVLDVSNNFLVNVPMEASKLSKLKYFDLSNNFINQINSESFLSSGSLSVLKVNGNLLKSVSAYAFHGLSTLPHLDLSEQKLLEIGNNGFVGLSELKTLDLSTNQLTELQSDWFVPLKKLVHLYLTHNNLWKVDPLLFNMLVNIQIVHTSQPDVCCLTTQQLVCEVESIQTIPRCDRAIPSTTVRVLSTILCVVIINANIIVIYIRLITKIRNANYITIVNLALADTVQGVCMAIIIANDLLYNEAYALTKWVWRKSLLCSTIGFLFPLTFSVSAISAILIALDRYKVIVNPFSSVTEGTGMKTRLIIILGTWISLSCVAYVPFILITDTDNQLIYSDICFIHLYDNIYSMNLYIYVTMLYGVFLLLAYGIVTTIYMAMVYKLRLSLSTTGMSTSSRHLNKLYIRLIIVCLSNMTSCMTIAIITYITNGGGNVNNDIVNGIVLVIRSMPAALNPFLYTIITSFLTEYVKGKKLLMH